MTARNIILTALLTLLIGFFLFGRLVFGEEATGPCVDRACSETVR